MSAPPTAAPAGPRSRAPWALPVLAGLAVVAILAAVVVLANQGRDSGAPPPAAPFVKPQPAQPSVAFDVERAESGRLVVTQGQDTTRRRAEITVPNGAAVDILEPARLDDLRTGDWLTVIGITNEARNYAIRMVLIQPAGDLDPDGFMLTPGGFLGSEAAREAKEFAIMSGKITAVRGPAVTIDVGGDVFLDFAEGAPLRRLRKGQAADIKDGDRIALHSDSSGNGDPARGVLVLAGGAR